MTSEIFFSLSPIQQWFINRNPEVNICFNVYFLLELRKNILTTLLQRALSIIVSRHLILRARFHKDLSGKWIQKITDSVASSFKLTSVQNCEEDSLSQVFVE